jgi:hypothetical protein
MRRGRRDFIAAALAVLGVFAQHQLATNDITCWEDEVVVIVVHDEYGTMEGTAGCVPADDLPTTGFRPEGN